MQFQLYPWVNFPQGIRQRFRFEKSHLLRKILLPVQVGHIHPVEIRQYQLPHAHSGKGNRNV